MPVPAAGATKVAFTDDFAVLAVCVMHGVQSWPSPSSSMFCASPSIGDRTPARGVAMNAVPTAACVPAGSARASQQITMSARAHRGAHMRDRGPRTHETGRNKAADGRRRQRRDEAQLVRAAADVSGDGRVRRETEESECVRRRAHAEGRHVRRQRRVDRVHIPRRMRGDGERERRADDGAGARCSRHRCRGVRVRTRSPRVSWARREERVRWRVGG